MSKLTSQSSGEQVGIYRIVPGEGPGGLRPAGEWSRLSDGSLVWRFRIRSPNATAIRVRFQEFDVGGGRLWLYSDSRRRQGFVGPYTGTGPQGRGEFWSGEVLSDSVIIEYRPESPSDGGVLAPFVISGISHAVSGGQPRSGESQ